MVDLLQDTWLYHTALCRQQGSANGFFTALFMDSHQLLECSCLEICLILGHSALSVSDQSHAEYANSEMSKWIKINDHFLFRDDTSPGGIKIRFRWPKTRTEIFKLVNQTVSQMSCLVSHVMLRTSKMVYGFRQRSVVGYLPSCTLRSVESRLGVSTSTVNQPAR